MSLTTRCLLFVTALLISSCGRLSNPPAQLSTRIISMHPHDPNAYTQGLQLHHGALYESTGLYGQSSLRRVEMKTGAILRMHNLPKRVFGEGMTHHAGNIFMLTWREQTAYELDPENLEVQKTHTYQGEGWGLTSDGNHLIKSDGTSTLQFIDSSTFAIVKTLQVTELGAPVINLNELEYVNGQIYANIYLSDRIVRIHPRNGRVIGSLDLSSLRTHLPHPHRAEVLNGIAFDEDSGHFLITGKYWPLLFELAVEDSAQ